MKIKLTSVFVDDQDQALYDDGIPAASFAVDDMQTEFTRLKDLGMVFRMEPAETGEAIVAIFDDTCGNLIQIYQA